MDANFQTRIKYDPKFMETLRIRLSRQTTRTLMQMQDYVVRSISIGQAVRRTRGGHLTGLDPSRPGDPPHVLYGRLRQSITHSIRVEAERIVGRIGTNVVYARRLELGFVGRDARGRNIHQAPRPFLRPALDRIREFWG